MKLEDEDLKLEATEDNYDNVGVTHTFKQGVHTDVNEMLLSKGEQSALKEFLRVQTYLINMATVAGSTDPERFYLVVDREHDTVVLAAVNYDISITMGISTLHRDIERFYYNHLFSVEVRVFIIQQIRSVI